MPKIPGVNQRTAVAALEKAGFVVIRQGRHIIMSNGVRTLTIPRHNPINAYTMGNIAKQAGFTPEEFRKLVMEDIFRAMVRGEEMTAEQFSRMSGQSIVRSQHYLSTLE